MKNLKLLALSLLVGVSAFADLDSIKFSGACIRGVGGFTPVSPTPGPMMKFEINSSDPNKQSQKMEFPALSANDPFFDATATILLQDNRKYEVSLKIKKTGLAEKFGQDVSLDNALKGNTLRLTRDLEDGTVIECIGLIE